MPDWVVKALSLAHQIEEEGLYTTSSVTPVASETSTDLNQQERLIKLRNDLLLAFSAEKKKP